MHRLERMQCVASAKRSFSQHRCPADLSSKAPHLELKACVIQHLLQHEATGLQDLTDVIIVHDHVNDALCAARDALLAMC